MSAPIDPWAKTAVSVIRLNESDVSIVHPFRSDDLISEADYVLDERLPYWADIWPASRILAGRVAREPDAAGRSLLELGCGLGLVSLGAALAGFDVLATDYYKPALEFSARNAEQNGAPAIRTLHWNWREPFPLQETFDYIVASDVLYEHEYGPLVADILFRLLKPGGTAMMADPGRIATQQFLTHCGEQGMPVIDHERFPITDEGRDQVIDVYRLLRTKD